ncbi:MAG: TonB-dependent receptor [Sphingomonadaceae bacterium]
MRTLLLVTTALSLSLPAAAQPAAALAGEAAGSDIIVTGFRAQNRLAVDAKRDSELIAEFLKSDDIGQQPDYNIADSFRRLPGVQTVFDEDEGRYVSIRGLNPSYTLGSLDGATIATAERGNRQLNLEAIPSTAVASLEVLKSRTPDIDGNAIGGTINLRTRSAFDRPGLSLIGNIFVGTSDSKAVPGTGFNRSSDDGANFRADATVTATFGPDDSFGILLSGSFSRKRRDQERLLPQQVPPATPATPAPPVGTTNLLWSNYPNSVDRYGGTVKLEARPGTLVQAELSYSYFTQDDNELRHSQQLLNTAGGSFVRFNDFPIRKPLHIGQGAFRIDGDGPHRLAGRASYSWAQFLEPSNELQFSLIPPAATFDIGLQNGFPVLANVSPRVADAREYRFAQYRPYEDDSQDRVLEAQLDYGWNSAPRDEGFGLGAGFKHRETRRDNDRTQAFWNPATGVDLRLAQFEQRESYQPIFAPFNQLFVDFQAFLDYFRRNPAQFAFNQRDSDRQSIGGDWVFEEAVSAAYILGRHAGPRHSLIFGVRYEDTGTRATGVQRRTQGAADIFTRTSRRSGYDHWLPSVTGRFDLTDDLRLRAAFFQAVGRPNPNQVAGAEIVNADGSLSRSNPDLKARFGTSYEASLEYYFPDQLGIASVAVFHKRVKDEIFTFIERESVNGVLVDVNQPRNAEDARVTGLELNLIVNRFGFLPGFLADFGASGNMTFLSGRTTIVATGVRRDLKQLPGQADFLANAALFYESGWFRGRVSYAHIGRHKTAVNAASPAADRTEAPFDQFDAQARAVVNDRIEIIGEVRNLTNQQRLNLTGPNQDIARDINRFGRQFWIGMAFKL